MNKNPYPIILYKNFSIIEFILLFDLSLNSSFGLKFMLAKNNASHKISQNPDSIDESLPKDIGNTQVIFDLKDNQNYNDKQ